MTTGSFNIWIFKAVLVVYRRIFARPIFRTLNTGLFRLGLHGLGILNYENNKVSGEDYFLRKILPRHIKSEVPVFFDVGANEGSYSADLIRMQPGGQVHAFEPHPATFAKLKRNLKAGNITCYNLALGATAAKTLLFDRDDCEGSQHATLHKAVLSDVHKIGVTSIEVEIETIDNVCKRSGITFIDLLKIDTEGHELAVLQGASELLNQQRIGCIHLEFNEMNIVSRVYLADFRKLLTGYDLYRLLPGDLLALGTSPLETELFAYQNIIALKKTALG